MVTENLIVEVDQLPVFNPEARLIKAYKALIERDKGSPGDADGRKKKLATKELAFVALYVGLASPYNRNYSKEEREAVLIRELELPLTWKIDDVVKEAMREYEKTQITPSSAMLVSVRNALYSAKSIVSLLEKRLKSTMNALYTSELIDDKDFDELMDKAMKDIDKVLDYSKRLTDQLASLDTLENKYVKEMEELSGKNKKEINKHQL